MHCVNKTDDAHAHLDYKPDVYRLIQGNGDDPDPGSENQTIETTQTDDSDNPMMGGPAVETEPKGSEAVELPCGHESYNPVEAPDPPFTVSCSACGQAWVVENE
jgi:hypothetical protein